jgi:hypothetical protein
MMWEYKNWVKIWECSNGAYTDPGVVVKHACGAGRLHTIWMYNPDSIHCNATVNVGQGNFYIISAVIKAIINDTFVSTIRLHISFMKV